MRGTRRGREPHHCTVIREIMRRDGLLPIDVFQRTHELGKPVSYSALLRTIRGETFPNNRTQKAIAAALATTEYPVTANDIFGEPLTAWDQAIVNGNRMVVAA